MQIRLSFMRLKRVIIIIHRNLSTVVLFIYFLKNTVTVLRKVTKNLLFQYQN